MDDVTRETSLFIKGLGVVIGECLFGLYGQMLFMHPLHWFEINVPGAIAIGVLTGASLGYGVATAVLWLRRHKIMSCRERHPLVVSAQLGANLRA